MFSDLDFPMSRPEAPPRRPATRGPAVGGTSPFEFQNAFDVRGHMTSRLVTVVVDSRDRDGRRFPRPDTYEIELPDVLRNVTEARLVSAELPSSFYVFREAAKNNAFHITRMCLRRKIQLPDGNYGVVSITETLTKLLNEAFSAQNAKFRVYIDPATFRCFIEDVSDVSTSFTIESPDYVDRTSHWGLPYYLGFPRNTVVESVRNGADNFEVFGVRPVLLNPEAYMLVDIEEFGRVKEPSIQGQGGYAGRNTTFAKIPIDVDSFEYVFRDTILCNNDITPPILRLSRLHIAFRFHDGTPVDFQGMDHSLTLQLRCSDVQAN